MDTTSHEQFRAIFDRAYTPVSAYARRRASRTEADDIVAEVFLVAWRRLDDIPAEDPLPWLYGVARRVLANQRRAAHRQHRLAQRLSTQPAGPTSDEHDDAVLAALAGLRPADQEILRLAAWEALIAAQIAVALDCSANAAALRLSRARARLRVAMTENEATRTQGQQRRSAGA